MSETPVGFGSTERKNHQKYPNKIKVIMTDGESITYIKEEIQPRPQVSDSIGIIRKWNEMDGYPRPRHKKGDHALGEETMVTRDERTL